MAKTHFFKFILKGYTKDLVTEVRESDINRLKEILFNYEVRAVNFDYFWFHSINGRSYAINLSYVQAVSYLWEPVDAPPDTMRDEGAIELYFAGKQEPLIIDGADKDTLYDLFYDLELKSAKMSCPLLIDDDGEEIQFFAREIVYVTAPSHMISEGEKIALERDGFDTE